MTTYTAQPSPTPTGTYTQTSVSPQPAPAPTYNSGATDWNNQWNNIWNQAWNAGFNNGSRPSVDPSFQSAVDQGYSSGYSEYQKRNTTTPTSTSSGQVLGTSSVQDPQQALWAEIDNIYNQSTGYLGNVESTLRANQPGVEQGIEGQYASGVKSLETQKAEGERGLAQEESATGKRKEDALTAGKRLYNELMLGGRQRFGGASSAGQAYGELTAREFQRGQAQTQSAFQTAMSKITDLKANLQDRFASALQNLETQKINAITEARRIFDEKLMEVNRMRAEAGQNRSSMRLELLQNLRNQIYQINLTNATSSQALQTQAQKQQTLLDQYEQRALQSVSGGQQATNNLLASTTVTPTSQFTMGNAARPNSQALTGRIREEELTGQVSPIRRDQFAFA